MNGKKRILFFLLAVLALESLCACGAVCEHEWHVDCLTPATCALCGVTAGEAPGHDWVEGDCTRAKTCVRCGVTEGEHLEHSWTGGQCGTVKTCTVCGKTDGEAVGHTWAAATCAVPVTCTDCGLTTGVVLAHTYSDWMVAEGYVFSRTCTCCGAEERVPFADVDANGSGGVGKDDETRHAMFLRAEKIAMEFLSGKWISVFDYYEEVGVWETEEPAFITFSNAAHETYWNGYPIEDNIVTYSVVIPAVDYFSGKYEDGVIKDSYLWEWEDYIVHAPHKGKFKFDDSYLLLGRGENCYYISVVTEGGDEISVWLHPDFPYGIMHIGNWNSKPEFLELGTTMNLFVKDIPDNPVMEKLLDRFYTE